MDKVTNQHIRNRSAELLVIPVTKRNLVYLTQSHKTYMACEVNKVTRSHLGHLTCDNDKLVEIGMKRKKDHRFSILNPSTVKNIRRFRLNK